MRRKIMTACLVIIAACLLFLMEDKWSLPGGHGDGKGRQGLKVGLSQSEPLTPWKTAQIKSFKEAAGRQGASLVYHPPREETVEWQVKDIEELLEQGIDYLILIPRARNGYDGVLMRAKEKGVPVILVEQDVEMDNGLLKEDYFLSYVASDYFAEGEQCADILADYFGIRSCQAMVIQGEKSSSMAWERYMGFMHGVRMHSNLYISKRAESSENRITAQKVTEAVIADQDIDFNAVFAQSDEDGLGVLQAMKLAGVEPGKDVAIVSIGGVQDVLKAIIAQEYLATVKSNPEYGDIVFDIIARHQKGEAPKKRTTVEHQIYTIENAEELFEDAY